MKVKTSELTGFALDWAVAKCELVKLHPTPQNGAMEIHFSEPNGCLPYSPSTDWAWGGPIIEREEIGIERRAPCMRGEEWGAKGSITAKGAGYRYVVGPTPLIAAMRCFVASKLGDDVDVPEELLI